MTGKGQTLDSWDDVWRIDLPFTAHIAPAHACQGKYGTPFATKLQSGVSLLHFAGAALAALPL